MRTTLETFKNVKPGDFERIRGETESYRSSLPTIEVPLMKDGTLTFIMNGHRIELRQETAPSCMLSLFAKTKTHEPKKYPSEIDHEIIAIFQYQKRSSGISNEDLDIETDKFVDHLMECHKEQEQKGIFVKHSHQSPKEIVDEYIARVEAPEVGSYDPELTKRFEELEDRFENLDKHYVDPSSNFELVEKTALEVLKEEKDRVRMLQAQIEHLNDKTTNGIAEALRTDFDADRFDDAMKIL